VQSVRSKEEKEVLDHFAGVVILSFFLTLPELNMLKSITSVISGKQLSSSVKKIYEYQ